MITADYNNTKKSSPSVTETPKQGEELVGARKCAAAQAGIWTEPMLAHLERGDKGTKWFSLIDKVMDMRTLGLAWEQVRHNAGVCGIDGVTVRHFDKDSLNRLLAVNEQIRQDTYQFQPAKRIWAEKPGSKDKRPIGIPTVKDRVVETALHLILEPIFEHDFAPHSYGFRCGRSCKDALRRVEKLLHSGYTHIVDVDIKRYFDSIPHEPLMKLVAARVTDGRVLRLIRQTLERGVLEGTEWQASQGEGTPQGGVISPLLANIYLNPLDWKMIEHGIEMVRYADDMVILCRSEADAQAALTLLKDWTQAAGLELHPEKTKLVNMNEVNEHFDFLGYRFKRVKSGKIMRLVRPKSRTKLHESVRNKTRRTRGDTMEIIIEEVNQTLRGWYGYFKQAAVSELKSADGWVRMRLRSILRKRDKRKGRGEGSDHVKWPNSYFRSHGYFSLQEAKERDLANLHQGATC